MTEEEVKILVKKRGTLKHKLTIIEKLINTIKTATSDTLPSLSDISLRFTNNISLLSEFEGVQGQIELACQEDDLEGHFNERELFCNRYYIAYDFLDQYLRNHSINLNQSTNVRSEPPLQASTTSQFDSLHNILLPKIKLPTFSGNFDNWLSFKVNFTTTIVENGTLTNSHKYQFLKASLEGYALRLIDGLDNSNEPFTSAWQLLCERFDKKQFLLDTHFKQILNIQSINKENFYQFNGLLDQITKIDTSIQGLNLDWKILYESFMIHILSNKFDKITLREWKELKHESELPTFKEFMNFLKNKTDLVQSLEQSGHNKTTPNFNSNNKYYPKTTNYQCNLSVNNPEIRDIKCNFCKNNHSIYKCQEFLNLPIVDRIEKVKQLNLCQNCLRTGHSHVNCTHGCCKTCKESNKMQKHNTLLHRIPSRDVPSTSRPRESFSQSVVNMMIKSDHSSYQTLLSTVVCSVKDAQGKAYTCRALLDSGAQSNLITDGFCKKLRLTTTPTNLSIIGITQSVSKITKKCDIHLYSNLSNCNFELSCFVVPTITSNVPFTNINIQDWKIPSDIKLADPYFQVSREIDLLLGANIFWDLIWQGRIELGQGLPNLQNTCFGYIVTGNFPIYSNFSICNFSNIHCPEDKQLKRFWELEELSSHVNFSKDETECENQFHKETIINEHGRFVVKFPLKYSLNLLGDNKETAIKRFISLEKRFSDAKFKSEYFNFIREYENLGHMKKLNPQEIANSIDHSYFLPHHGVLKEDSLTTKLRIVFDASCPSSTGWSLNDLQYTGPKVQNDIIDILLRFRTYTYVVSADVSKMYRQILMHPNHIPFQQILWRENPDDEFSVYRLNTVTYGTSSAPYLAIKCIQQIAIDNLKQFPEACQTILDDFYVDDLLTGSNNLEHLQIKCEQIYHLLKARHFNLRKWIANNSQIISHVSDRDISNSVINLGQNESCKTLGIQWVAHEDILKYNIKSATSINTSTITKRNILSIIAQVYDPLGLLSPSILISKIIIQKLWSLKISWDSDIPLELQNKFFRFHDELTLFNDMVIPRNTIPSKYKLFDIHCFCDASKDAYAAAVYLRSKNDYADFNIQLLCSKTKVAPLKTISIPKLELCASLLGAQLVTMVQKTLAITVPIYIWSDSQIVLAWIQIEPSKLQVFVANRVSMIQSITSKTNWRYVNTKDNPADLASRGLLPSKLISSSLWWNGPQFLKHHTLGGQITNLDEFPDQLPELKGKVRVLHTVNETTCELFKSFSDVQKLIKITAWCIRFITNSQRIDKQTGPLTVDELTNANKKLIRLAQSECFRNEIKILTNNARLESRNRLSSLTPFIDNEGILRVGGRLKNTTLPHNVKHPILLSSKHVFTKLIIEHKHKQLLHPGPQLLLAAIRQFYWPIGGHNLVKAVTKNCLTCFKFNPRFATYPMSALPESRIKANMPFEIIGIDYAGPFSILNKPGRGAKIVKAYLAVFVCFCTKAVHLETITNLTTENFLSCLMRFTARRGVPTTIYSDNGTTFVGANNELKDLGHFIHKNQNTIINKTNQFNIRWNFIPPYTPNFGGLWEAAVKSAKHFIKRALINRNVTYEEFNTLIIQVEGILNSRPLFAASNDPNDLTPITPSHFLIGRALTSLPQKDLQHINSYRLTRLQHIHQLQQQIWTQFSRQYISQLHQQYKWKEAPTKLAIGTLVLVKNDKQPSHKWPLGRIVKLLPTKDGISRVAELRVSSGTVLRSVRHLCPLPMQEETEN